MTKQGWMATLMLLTGLSAVSLGLLAAQDQAIPRQQRISPKVLKEALGTRPIGAAELPHRIGRTTQALRVIANDFERAGQKAEAERLNAVIRDFVSSAEQEIADKKAQIAQLNAEIDGLKLVVGQ